MTEHDPSDLFLSNLTPLGGTPERDYYIHETSKTLVASWKAGSANHYDLAAFQRNALIFAKLIEDKNPKCVIVDCRYLGFEISESDQRWYIDQTRKLWEKTDLKRIAFIFKANLTVQMSMEGLQTVSIEEGIRQFEYRIFESVIDAFNWINNR